MNTASPRRLLLLPLLLLSALVACSGGGSPTSAASSTSAPQIAVERPALPTSIRIPSIEVSSSLVATGLNPDGTIEVPPVTSPLQASWYDGTLPGEPDTVPHWTVPGGEGPPAVVLGHVDGQIGGRKGQPGVFYRLHELKPGALVEITVGPAAATPATFQVDRVERYDKDAFPTEAVYGDLGVGKEPQLRLITCGGLFDHAARSYEDNVVVFASRIHGSDT